MPRSLTNEPFFVALQVVPSLAHGGTGVGKSSVMEALAGALGRTFVPLLGSTHLPEDFSGYPTPDRKANVVRMMPTSWVQQTMDGNAFVFVDEVTNVPPATQAGLLSIITERRVGDVRMPASTLIAGACNPAELCPNAVPLAPAMRSRFFHHQWEIERESWFAGLRHGCEWSAPEFPLVPANWTDGLPQFGSLVEAFLRSAPDCMEKLPSDDETLSFPNPRTWTYLVRCFAAAESCGYERKHPIYKALGMGCVGDAAGGEFLRYWHQLDLVNPEAVLEGDESYEYESRPDANICLLTGLVRALRANTSKERWLRAAKVFIEIGEHEIESFLLAFRPFWHPVNAGGVRPDNFTPPKDVMSKMMAMIQS
jgi:hypothetical protein